jgi:hypothetical protein
LLACTSSTLRSGAPPGKTAEGYARRWHPAFLFGAIAWREPYELSRICPNGWAEIKTGPDEFTILAGLVTLFVYSPSRITIVCAAPPGSAPPPLPELPQSRE